MRLQTSIRRYAVLIILALAATTLIAPPAQAGHGGAFPVPDNRQQALSRVNLTEIGHRAAQQGVDQLNRTVITMSTGGGDIYAYDDNYGTAWYGRTVTSGCSAGNPCDRFTVQFNLQLMRDLTPYRQRTVGCHEFGHTGGLGHRAKSATNSCMPSWGPGDVWYYAFDSHDINAVNNWV